MALKALVLPAPLGPIRESTSPVRTSKLMPSHGSEPAKADGQTVDDKFGVWRMLGHRAASLVA